MSRPATPQSSVTLCPRCGSDQQRTKGSSRGKQQYYCHGCKRKWTEGGRQRALPQRPREKICAGCGGVFMSKRPYQCYCSRDCVRLSGSPAQVSNQARNKAGARQQRGRQRQRWGSTSQVQCLHCGSWWTNVRRQTLRLVGDPARMYTCVECKRDFTANPLTREERRTVARLNYKDGVATGQRFHGGNAGSTRGSQFSSPRAEARKQTAFVDLWTRFVEAP